jgi:hypothetical protein
MTLARAGGLLLLRQALSAARFLCRMRIAASSARRFNSASSGVNRKNSKKRLLISFSPVLFAPAKQSGVEATFPVAAPQLFARSACAETEAAVLRASARHF